MSGHRPREITLLLRDWCHGDQAAQDKLLNIDFDTNCTGNAGDTFSGGKVSSAITGLKASIDASCGPTTAVAA